MTRGKNGCTMLARDGLATASTLATVIDRLAAVTLIGEGFQTISI